MHNIVIKEIPWVIEYLVSRWLLEQYRTQKAAIQSGTLWWAFFKKRKPIESTIKQVFYFRLNKKYRAFARYKDWIYVVYKIDDHQ